MFSSVEEKSFGTQRQPSSSSGEVSMLTRTTTASALVKAPIMISQDDARQGPLGHRVLYVLGFGLAGAILANVLVFIYFASFYAPG
jgi:hypothetical protein